jgi:DNA-binding CsgD family transcriptional regulator
MAIRERLLRLLGVHPSAASEPPADSSPPRVSIPLTDSAPPAPGPFDLDEEVIRAVRELAEREQRPVGEVASALLNFALEHRRAAEENLRNWQELTAREQQIVAMTCQNLTTQEIADRLCITSDTVKTHVRHGARKLGLRTKLELRLALMDWDFSAWNDGDFVP